MIKNKCIEYEIPVRKSSENLIDYALKLANIYRSQYNLNYRSCKGQFFTPKKVSQFIAGLVKTSSKNIRLLDPGAGNGILTAAFCEKVINYPKRKVNLQVDAYEIDSEVIPYLKRVLDECKKELKNHSHNMDFDIFEKDFIMSNYHRLEGKMKMLFYENNYDYYDVIISNPPYYKLNKASPQSSALNEIIYGQPNIYTLFIALSASMLKKNGQMIFITPRSFCSGLYYKRFRTWLLERTELKNIHIFESRKNLFSEDDVLQENIIFKSVKKRKKSIENNDIFISVSKDKLFADIRKFKANNKNILYKKNGDIFIRIPSSEIEIKLLEIIDNWPYTLKDLGIEISTGPVVSFRARKHLISDKEKENSVPLLWMHNLKDWKTVWPVNKNHKELAIALNEQSKKLLLPIKNYVLLKRFSSKEQKRRLYASVFLKNDFKKLDYVGIENHVNYIHKYKRSIDIDEAYGIAALLNTNIIDLYFRTLNGNTQVNANDIRSMPLPSINKIKEIGNIIKNKKPKIDLELDKIVAEKVNINKELVIEIYGRDKQIE